MEELGRKKFKRRIICGGISIFFIFTMLFFRLYYIQVYNGHYYSNLALKQRSKKVALEPKRGTIYDRNNIKITNNTSVANLILQKELLEEDINLYREIESNTLLTKEELKNIMETDENTLEIPLKRSFQLSKEYSNLFLVDKILRYNKENILSHVIGYINKAENSGESGIERTFDEFLRIEDTNSLILEYSKNKSLIIGGEKHVIDNIDPRDPVGVKLTIDYGLQKDVEKILNIEKLNGAVLISEVDSGEILVMASRPNFDQNEIQKLFNTKDMALYNKAIQVSYPPGSIFKIVVLLALLEDEDVEIRDAYFCQGFQEINGIKINCTNEHGWIRLEDGFAKSCNSLFVQIGQDIGAEKIIEMSKKLGLGEKINLGLLEEVAGKLPGREDIHGAAIGNISIGQGKIQVTPLQMNSILSTILNGGVKRQLTLVKGITNSEGKIIKEYMSSEDIKVLSKGTCEKTIEMLKLVVEQGTGRKMNLGKIGGAGGKTGSAQAVINGRPVINAWFTGFYPKENPKYIVTVLVEDSISGSQSAAPIFEEIVNLIHGTCTNSP